MKTLITGGCGFVGSSVLRHLLQAGHEVRVLVRPSSNRCNIDGLPVEVVTGDLTDPGSLHGAVKGCRSLFHVAADYRLWVPKPGEIYRTNVDGTRSLMIAAAEAGVHRIVYTSSVATLGLKPDGTPADEETPVCLGDMIGHYKRSKFLAEAEVKRLVEEEGLPAVIVNPSTPLGPRDIKCTPTGNMILQAASGHMPAYVDTGLNFIHVDDVGRGHLLAFERGRVGERYILGAWNMTLKEILTELSLVTGRPAPRIRLPHNLLLPLAFLTEVYARSLNGREPFLTLEGVRLAKKKMFFSAEKAKRELGLETRPIREALIEAVSWFRQNGFLNP